MHEWQNLSHVRWDCKYHVVIIPKYRRKVLNEETYVGLLPPAGAFSPQRPLRRGLPDTTASGRGSSFRDAEREPRIAESGVPLMDDMRTGVKEQVGWMLGRTDGHCVFFDPEQRLCTIYDTRPLECRIFNCDGPEGEIFRDPEGRKRRELGRHQAWPQLQCLP